MRYLVRVTAPHYVAGVVVDSDDHGESGTVVRAAPILKWAIGLSVNVLLYSCERRGYVTETLVAMEKEKDLTAATTTRYNQNSKTGVSYMSITKGVVAVNIKSQYDDDRRIKLDGQPEWYGSSEGLSDKLKVGNRVQVKTEGEGKQLVIVAAKVDETGVALSKPSGGGGYKGGGGKSQMSKEEWSEKDRSIRYQHSQKVAASLLEVALAATVITIPKKNAEAVLLEKFDQYTAYVYSDIEGREALVRVNGETNEETKVDPEGEDDGFDDDEDEDGFE